MARRLFHFFANEMRDIMSVMFENKYVLGRKFCHARVAAIDQVGICKKEADFH